MGGLGGEGFLFKGLWVHCMLHMISNEIYVYNNLYIHHGGILVYKDSITRAGGKIAHGRWDSGISKLGNSIQ